MMSRRSLTGCGRTAAGSPFSGKITLTASVGVKEHECPVLTFLDGNILKYRYIRFYPLVSLAGRPVPVKFLHLPDKGSGSGGLTAIPIALGQRQFYSVVVSGSLYCIYVGLPQSWREDSERLCRINGSKSAEVALSII